MRENFFEKNNKLAIDRKKDDERITEASFDIKAVHSITKRQSASIEEEREDDRGIDIDLLLFQRAKTRRTIMACPIGVVHR